MVAEARAADDTAAVTAANDAFYAAETARDPSAMERLWAHEDYVAFVGPRTKEPIVGWNALQPYWARSLGNFAQFSLTPVDTHIRVSGDTAWVIGKEEIGTGSKLKDGTPISSRPTIVTNVFERHNGKWLMVVHHAQEIP